jgi:hypothetical protein
VAELPESEPSVAERSAFEAAVSASSATERSGSGQPAPRRRRRRVTTAPPPGTDPTPASEPERHTLTENDERLKAEKPPHY